MQANDLPCNPHLDLPAPDPSTMSDHSSPIHSPNHHSPQNKKPHVENNTKNKTVKEKHNICLNNGTGTSSSVIVRRERPSRACTQRAAARLQAAAQAEASVADAERRKKNSKRKERLTSRLLKEESDEEGSGEEEEEEEGQEDNGELKLQCSKIVTPLVGDPEPSQLPRWNIRSMWQLAAILNFLNVFRPFLNIKVEFSAEEFETALLNPNNTLGDIHMPLLKAIPPVTRMALGHGTWITVLCRKLRDWWHWVAEGDLPIVSAHGAEVEAYNSLDPGIRVVILKALCDIRVEQEDIRHYIDDSIKHGVSLSLFRKQRIGGDSHGISYWYEDDSTIGHRLYREIRKYEVKKGKGKTVAPMAHSCFRWETIATNLDEFKIVSEKLFSSKNRTEVSIGKKLKNDMLLEVEKAHKRKEKLLKKQHRQALMLDNMMNMDGLAAGRSLRDRKPVTYTFDDYDRSISEAIKVTKNKEPCEEPSERRDPVVKPEVSTNGRRGGGPSQNSRQVTFSAVSPKSSSGDEFYDDQKNETLDRSNRKRQRPQRYSVKEFVEAVSDNDADFDSDDDIVGEVVYDDEYLRTRKQRRRMSSSSSEGDEEYHFDEEKTEEEEEEEEEEDNLSTSEESDAPRRFKPSRGRTRRETKLRSVGDLQSGLRRSKRATRNRINYKQLENSESETEAEKSNALDEQYNNNAREFSMGSQDSEDIDNKQEMDMNEPIEEEPLNEIVDTKQPEKQPDPPEETIIKDEDENENEVEGMESRRFLDLNELAPGSGFEDGPNPMRDDGTDDF